jgi:hypothetical protein
MLKKLAIKSLVLFLLLSQLVTVAHALDHESVHEDNEQCFICIHSADLDNTLLNSSTLSTINAPAFEKTNHQSQDVCLTTFSLLKNRSPPVIL